MVETIEDLRKAFKENYELEKRMLERALGVEIREYVDKVDNEPSEEELYTRVVKHGLIRQK